MANPNRFPAGISTFPTRHVLNSYPSLPNNNQAAVVNEFLPYRSGDFTLTQTNGAVASTPWNGGTIKISTTGSTTSDSANLQFTPQSFQFVPGNQLWLQLQFTAATPITDANMYAGFADSTNFATCNNGVFFIKPSGGTAVHLNIVKGGVTTQFQNVSDIQYPDGLYNSMSTVGTLTSTGTGGVYTGATVATAGSGYLCAPYIQTTGATGSGAQLYCQLGSGGLYAPYLANGGSSYTTYTNSVSHWIQHQLYYDGKGTLYVGVNGRQVISVGLSGGTNNFTQGIVTTAGGTYNTAGAASQNYFVSGTQLSTTAAPVQPKTGDVYNILPTNLLYGAGQITNTTANARAIVLDSFNIASEYN